VYSGPTGNFVASSTSLRESGPLRESGTLGIRAFGTQHHAQGERPEGRSHVEVFRDSGVRGLRAPEVKHAGRKRGVQRRSVEAPKRRSVEFLYNSVC
jgi:hypothetical protein